MKKLSTLLVFLCFFVAARGQYTLTKLDVNNSTGSAPAGFTSFQDKTYFVADDGVTGFELWWTDGHSYGLVADINPGVTPSINSSLMTQSGMCVLNGKLYFPATDGVHGVDIWEYNGVTPPKMVVDIDTAGVYGMLGNAIALDGWLYFKVQKVGQVKVARLHPVSHYWEETSLAASLFMSSPMVAFNGKLVFSASGSKGNELYEYDPATDLTIVTDINPGGASSGPNDLYVYGNTLFFVATSSANGRELYRYDVGDTVRRITDLVTGTGFSFGVSNSEGSKLMMYNNKLYFTALHSSSPRYKLFNYDPVTDTVQLVTEMGAMVPATGLAVYGRKLYIAADSNSGSNEGLFFYDGTTTRHLSSIGLNTFTIPRDMTESNGRLYFSDWDFVSPSISFEAYVLTDSVALDVQEVEKTEGIVVYPVPAANEVYFGFTQKKEAILTIRLTDVQGRLAIRLTQQYGAGRNEAMVQVANLAPGTYGYTIMSEDGAVMGKGRIVKQ